LRSWFLLYFYSL